MVEIQRFSIYDIARKSIGVAFGVAYGGFWRGMPPTQQKPAFAL